MIRTLILSAVISLPVQAGDVTVFAAASLKTALDEIAAAYTGAGDDVLRISYGGSPVLARQIMAGAPADLFISASVPWMDAVAEAVPLRARRDLLGNRLVLIAHGAAAEPIGIADLPARLGTGRLAMALVDAVPAGQYGQQALRALGLWDVLAPRVAQSDDVRAALALVALGAAPYGVTYASDAVAEPRVTAIYDFPSDSHDAITYPAALLTDNPAAAAFLEALSAPQATAIFAANGFTVRP